MLEGASDPWCEPSSGPPPPPVEAEGGEAACRRLFAAALWCSPSADRGDALWVRWPGGPDGKPHVEHVQAGGSPTRTRRGTPAEAMGKAIAAATRPRAWGWARRIEGYPVNRASGWRRERVPYVMARPSGSAVLAALAVEATNHGEEAAHLRAWLGIHAPELASLVEG